MSQNDFYKLVTCWLISCVYDSDLKCRPPPRVTITYEYRAGLRAGWSGIRVL